MLNIGRIKDVWERSVSYDGPNLSKMRLRLFLSQARSDLLSGSFFLDTTREPVRQAISMLEIDPADTCLPQASPGSHVGFKMGSQ